MVAGFIRKTFNALIQTAKKMKDAFQLSKNAFHLPLTVAQLQNIEVNSNFEFFHTFLSWKEVL